jgi:hypothetical protein
MQHACFSEKIGTTFIEFKTMVARLFRTFPGKVAEKFEKNLPFHNCRVKQLFQTPFIAKDNPYCT